MRQQREVLDRLPVSSAGVDGVDHLLHVGLQLLLVEGFFECRVPVGTTRAVTYGFPSPTTTARSMRWSRISSNSNGCGATYLPTAVLNSAFLRSVILRNPSASISPMSPE